MESEILWKSVVTMGMVGEMDEEEIEVLIEELNDAVDKVVRANKLKG
jgi:predicted metal-dependent peptidase